MIWEGQWEVAISETFYPSVFQNVTGGKIMFFGEKLSKTTKPYFLEPGLYSSETDIVETMTTLIQGRNDESDTCIRIRVNRLMQKNEMYLAN